MTMHGSSDDMLQDATISLYMLPPYIQSRGNHPLRSGQMTQTAQALWFQASFHLIWEIAHRVRLTFKELKLLLMNVADLQGLVHHQPLLPQVVSWYLHNSHTVNTQDACDSQCNGSPIVMRCNSRSLSSQSLPNGPSNDVPEVRQTLPGTYQVLEQSESLVWY